MSVLSPDNPSTSFGAPRIPKFLVNIANASVVLDEKIDWFDHTSYLLSSGRSNSVDGTNQSVFFFGSQAHIKMRSFCKEAVTQRIDPIGIRYWDLAILVPNLLFLIFLMFRYRQHRHRLRKNGHPIYKAFFFLVYFTAALNLARCFASIIIGVSNQAGRLTDIIIWLAFKYLLLSSELSVLALGLLFDYLENWSSVRNTLIVSWIISFIHLTLQAVTEFLPQNENGLGHAATILYLLEHSGFAFWMASSAIFVLIYCAACMLPFTCIRFLVTLPVRCSFYAYCLFHAILNAIQMVGAALILIDQVDGLCIVDLTTFIYFTFYAPLVYLVFLHCLLRNLTTSSGGGPLFSYRKHKDEATIGELPDASSIYYPRFSGITSPSYDDLFEWNGSSKRTSYKDPAASDGDFYHPSEEYYALMADTRTPRSSTIITNLDLELERPTDWPQTFGLNDRGCLSRAKSSNGGVNSFGTRPRCLRGLGPNGMLLFSDQQQLNSQPMTN